MRDFLRHVNLVWAILGVWLCGIVGWYLIARYRADELHLLRSQLAVSILVFFAFDTALRWRIWLYLMPGQPSQIDWFVPLASLGATVGMICMCRILAPVRWGLWRWFVPVGMVCVAMGFSQWWLA